LLLRQHQGHGVTELAFFNDTTDLLLSSGTNNEIVISSIVDAIYDQPMSFQALKVIPSPAQRVKWHPTNSNKIAIVNENIVYVTDLTNVTVDGLGSESLEDISIVCDQIASQVNDIVFSPDGNCLLTAGSDGFVHVFRVAGRPNGTAAECIHRFQPFDGEDVTSLHFFAENFGSLQPGGLLIGGNGNSKISLWNAPLTENVQPMTYQTVKLVDRINDDAPQFETLFDASTQFLFVADRGNPVIYVLHLAPSVNNRTPRRFDNVTEFTIAYPILSMCALNRHGQGQPSETVAEDPFGFFIHLYCIQTQAIQRYNVPPSSCFLPGRASRGSIEDEIPSIETQTVGAMTTEGENIESIHLHQSTAESPRATGSSPETG
jgi:enhancer of mRNA-decapping protein 4